MSRDETDETLSCEVLDGGSGERSVDLETVDEDRGGDELVSGHFLEELVVGSLVKGDGVVGLVLDLSLGPLLLRALEDCLLFRHK